MTVKLSETRDAYVFEYDVDSVMGETVDVRCTNPNDLSDISTMTGLKNDGDALVTFPKGYSGETEVVVSGSDGGEDAGTISVGVSMDEPDVEEPDEEEE